MKKIIFFVLIFVFNSLFAENIVFNADSMIGSMAKSSEFVKLEGNAYIKTETMEIRAQSIELSGTDYRIINAQGNISGKNFDLSSTNDESGFDFLCQTLSYDRKTKIAVLQGNVEMSVTQEDVVIKAQLMEYNQNTETALLQIQVELKKGENVCTSAFAVYRKKQKLLEMSGQPKIMRKDDVFKAQEIIFNLDTEEILLDGKVSGTVTDSKEKKETEKK